MGDRCYLTLNYAACDREAVEAQFGPAQDETEVDGVVTAGFEDVNYGGDGELRALSAARIPYWGRHENGQEYDACHVAGTAGGTADNYESGPWHETLAAPFNLRTGRVSGLARARRFRKLYLRAQREVAARAKAAVEKKGIEEA